jgi:hypothetical protein
MQTDARPATHSAQIMSGFRARVGVIIGIFSRAEQSPRSCSLASGMSESCHSSPFRPPCFNHRGRCLLSRASRLSY